MTKHSQINKKIIETKNTNRTFVIADAHGSCRALKQCLERSKFDFEKDRLICLGDFCDGWVETVECFELLFTIKDFVYVMGNHDFWAMEWLVWGRRPYIWTSQGGENTIKSYLNKPEVMHAHGEFLKKANYYYIDEKNRCFVHGGVSQKGVPIRECHKDFLSWDRDLWDDRKVLKKIPEFTEVYVGHTSIWRESETPVTVENVTFMDTGGGFEGKLSLMDINTKEFWQSDKVSELYPEERGRY